jgi:hypothetical protein
MLVHILWYDDTDHTTIKTRNYNGQYKDSRIASAAEATIDSAESCPDFPKPIFLADSGSTGCEFCLEVF